MRLLVQKRWHNHVSPHPSPPRAAVNPGNNAKGNHAKRTQKGGPFHFFNVISLSKFPNFCGNPGILFSRN